MVKIKFCGAAGGDVTGSKHLIKTDSGEVLLDCGLAQGKRSESMEKNRNIPIDFEKLSAVILSHAHIDHTGAAPILVKNGFSGNMFLTPLTAELSRIMLLDSARLQYEDAKFYNKIHQEEGDKIEPLYDEDDAIKTISLFNTRDRGEFFSPIKGIQAGFLNAGHVLGSSSVLLEVEGERVLYTGDIGRSSQILLKSPELEKNIDWLITETTYGNREHGDIKDIENEFSNIINEVYNEGGKIIIPSFSLERTQEIIYIIDRLKSSKKIAEIPIYVDSPMSVRVTDIFNRNLDELDFSNEFKKYAISDKDPFGYEYIHYLSSVEESKRLNDKKGPMIIISASGMCEGGRVLHHIRNAIDDDRNILLIVGYQAANTLGRRLKDGAKKVKIFGLSHDVNFSVKSIDFFSSHAGRSDLLNYVKGISPKKGVFLVHGEDDARTSFSELLKENGFKNIYLPKYCEEFNLK